MLPYYGFIQVTGQGQMVPSAVLGYLSDETHSVGSVTGAMIPSSTICWSFFFNFFPGFNWNFPVCMLYWGY